jgi:4,5-DOPA dioxygenase extradiol
MSHIDPVPSLFVSHGAPDILLSEHEAAGALRDLAARLPEPRAIVIVSAHWIDNPVSITAGRLLPTIHDFGGFPNALYRMLYPSQGDDALSADVARRLQEAMSVDSITGRGYP